MHQKQVGLITGLHCIFISKSIGASFELSNLSFWDLNSNQYIRTSFTLLGRRTENKDEVKLRMKLTRMTNLETHKARRF